jgi:two-component system nitrogen regulation response regulator GlnG
LENVAGEIVVFSRGQPKATLPHSVRSMLADEANNAFEQSRPSSESTASATPISADRVADALARSNGSASRAAKILGVSRTTYYELRRRHPGLRSVTAIPDAEIVACREECGGDIAKMADRLRVPIKALKDRLAQLSRRG